jgi:hypothetical protein
MWGKWSPFNVVAEDYWSEIIDHPIEMPPSGNEKA